MFQTLRTQPHWFQRDEIIMEKEFSKTDVMSLTQQAILDAGYGPLAAVLILRSLAKILDRD
jgi:hypothetical protein